MSDRISIRPMAIALTGSGIILLSSPSYYTAAVTSATSKSHLDIPDFF